MSEEPRKRSRFDQTEPEPKRHSRFDRRSRSPSGKTSEPRRSRSPIPSSSKSPDTGSKSKVDPAAAAAAAAAKINAQIQAKKGIQHIDVPPIRSPSSATGGATTSTTDTNNLNGEIYQQDGDYIKDIEVNDLRNRYTLTKGATQKMIKEETGADVTTRGNYYPDKSMATPTAPPLYLHVTSTSKEGLEKAVQKIEELMKQELPNLIDERRFRRREPEQVERDELGRRKWPEERIPIDLEPIPGFNLRAQVVGLGGSYVKHIQAETRCRVQIKGRGSGFIDHGLGHESDDPMYLHVAGPDPNDVKHAKELCEDLLANVKEQYQQFKERGPRHSGQHYGGSGNSGGNGGYGNGGYDRSDRDRDGQAQNSAYGYGGHQSPPSAIAMPGGAASPTANDYTAQYAAYYAANPSQDPYAAYGGYQNYVTMYYQYYGQQAQQGATAVPGPPGAVSAPGVSSSPPPAPSEAPPPPPSGSPGGVYNSVPPPPGM